MPVYEIEQYEIHTSKYRVEAESEAEALTKFLDNEGEMIDDSTEYIEIANDFGIPMDGNQELFEELEKLGVVFKNDLIESIRDVKEVVRVILDQDRKIGRNNTSEILILVIGPYRLRIGPRWLESGPQWLRKRTTTAGKTDQPKKQKAKHGKYT